MTASLNQLVETWQRQPDERNTIALCEQLGESGQLQLIEEVGKRAAVQYASKPLVLMAIARMYLGASRLGDAQGLLVSAGKMVPKNAEVYRWLGEVLLRRGDAERASKVLERAIVLGKIDNDTVFWRNQADEYVALQKRSGAQAVVAALSEVLISMGLPPPKPSTRAPARMSAPPPLPTNRHQASSDSDVTVVKKPPFPVDEPPTRGRPNAGPMAAPKPPPQPPPPPLPSPFAPVGKPTAARPITVPPPSAPKPPSKFPPPPLPSLASQNPPMFPDVSAGSLRAPAVPATSSLGPPFPSFAPLEPPTHKNNDGRSGLPAFDLAPPPPARSPLADATARLSSRPGAPMQPREVLSALALTGVFEPAGGAAPVWDAAPKTKTRFSITLVVLTALLVGAGIGAWKYVRGIRSQQAEVARGLDAEVTALLESGKVNELANTETKLSRSFDLDANSPTTAMLWVKNRVLRAIEVEGESQGIDTGVARARQVSIPESEVAFAHIASFIAQGDTAGAAALLPQWDAQEKNNAYFQLLAGVALERAGDLRAIDRYQLAVNLAPDLVPAQIMLARAMALEGDRNRAAELTRAFRSKWPDRPEGAALVVLTWARDPARGPAPPELDQVKSHREELPIALRPVPGAGEALVALDRHAEADAKSAIDRAIGSANTPGMATWLGTLALQMGDDVLARRAALQAVAFSAIYPQARVLAARVALAGGRLDEAMNAITELDPSLPDVAIVRATAAYEKLDADGLSLAMESLPADIRQRPELAALAKAGDILRGNGALEANKIRSLANLEVAWGDVIAIDAALDSGNLPIAKELLDRFGDAKDRPPRALRLARYLRYTEHAADAEGPSKQSLGLPTARTIVERVLLMLATKRDDDAHALVAKNAPLLGPMANWVLAYIDAGGPHAAEARSKAALLDPPGPNAPLLWRVVTALAMGDLGDRKRGGDLLRSLGRALPRNPDVIVAADSFRH
jgi:thioredoxin-like negative regulator of GroEL